MALYDPVHEYRRTAEIGLRSVLNSHFNSGLISVDLEWQPASQGKGDLALPCFGLAKKAGMAPVQLALKLASALNEHWQDQQPSFFAQVVAEGGFVNLTFNWTRLTDEVLATIDARKTDYGRGPPTHQRILLEHTSANPTGPMHIGRARNPLIGDSLARLLASAGNEVTTEYYVNDVGRQAAVLTYGMEHFPVVQDSRKADHRLVEAYRKANAAMDASEEDPHAREAIYAILEACEAGEPEALERVKEATSAVLAGMRESLTDIGVVIDNFFFESELLSRGAVTEVIQRLKALETASSDEGAHYLDLTSYNLPAKEQRFVFTRTSGLSLYTTRDLAYHLDKFTRCDRAIDVLGEDHKLQARQLAAALELMGEPVPQVQFYSFVNLPEGRMSTRQGRAVHLDDLLEEARHRAAIELAKRRPDLGEAEREQLADAIGLAALRFNLLKVQPEKPLTFRWEEALSFEGFAAPYILYSHARACSILRKAEYENKTSKAVSATPSEGPQESQDCSGDLLKHPSELALIKLMASFPSLVQTAARDLKPHMVPNYLYELATAFNQFYRDCPVLTASDDEFKKIRLSLVAAARQVLANALDLMGITALDRM